MFEKTKRKEISLSTSVEELIIIMSEGNPGVLRIVLDILNHDPTGFIKILSLDDMNIRGEQIWYGYKDHCDGNLEKFLDCIHQRCQQMIDTINNQCSRHKAVNHGTSIKR